MERGPAEEAVVIVKPGAGEVVVTQLRVKRQVSGRQLEMKGGQRQWSRKLIKDDEFEISLSGATDYPRRRYRAHRKRDDRRKTQAKRE